MCNCRWFFARLGGVLVLLVLGMLPGSALCDQSLLPAGRQKVRLAVPLAVEPFPLEDVTLLDGPFRQALERDRRYLLSLDVDRLLHTFRLNAGVPTSAEPLGGWEEPKGELRGHFLGHYLSACALMYAATGDERLKQKGDAVVTGLAECQAKLGSGYLSAFPEEFIDRVEARKRVWAPYYTLHKILAGLLDMDVYGKNPQALDMARKFGDWIVARNDRLSDERMQAMLGTEHGGMNEALANLYALTGDRKYLDASLRFNHHAVIDPAANQVDKLTGLHANTQIPKFIGNARQYELTGDETLKRAAAFFWNTVVHERSYVIGGHSNGEAFSPKETLSQALGPNTTETCNTYNMLKLTRHLFCWDPRAEYADYYERALVNHILASQDPDTGMMCYYVPLRSGSRKVYNGPLNGFWCCTGTGVENHAKYGDSIYFHANEDLYVNLFVASELRWKEKGVTVRQETQFPEGSTSRLTFTCERPVRLGLQIRHPAWATSGFRLELNGEALEQPILAKGWITVDRTWTTGDTLAISAPFLLYTEAFRDNPHRLAFLNGPLVLCAEVDRGGPFPAIVSSDEELLGGISPIAGRWSTFRGSGDEFRLPGEAESPGVTLEPFYAMHGARRYVVYWDVFSPEAWRTKQGEYRADLQQDQKLDARTLDRIQPGEDQNERDHALNGEHTSAGDFSGRKWRHATDGGWFSYTLSAKPGTPLELLVTYWGGDGGNRVFDIQVEGRTIATQRLENLDPGRFVTRGYPIPADLVAGKSKVALRFQAHPDAWAGGVFELRLVRAEAEAKP
jgi:DUF1680 family protein